MKPRSANAEGQDRAAVDRELRVVAVGILIVIDLTRGDLKVGFDSVEVQCK